MLRHIAPSRRVNETRRAHDSRRARHAPAFPDQQAMEFHGLGNDAHTVTDFFRGQILRDKSYDLSLARRQIDHTVRTRIADGSLHNPYYC